MEEKLIKVQKGTATDAKKNAFKWQDYLIMNFKTVIGLAVVVVFVAGYFLVLKPKYDDINKQAVEAQGNEIEKISLNSQLKRLEKAKKQYEEIDPADLEKVDEMLPGVPGKDELLSQLEGLILRNGLLLTSLQIEEVKEVRRSASIEGEGASLGEESVKDEEALSPEIGKIRITMDVAGTDYENLKKILSVIENNVRLLDVIKISFAPETSKTSLEMLAYYLKSK